MPSSLLSKAAHYFTQLIGPSQVLSSSTELAAWQSDWSKNFCSTPALVLLPATTAEVSAIMAYCWQHRLPVVPSGGRTGLVGGAMAGPHEIILSLQRMNKVIGIDRHNMSIESEAGVITAELQRLAATEQLYFPIDLAAKGSCQIGGNIATNAGGLKFIRFSGTREQVLGLEVVLADGRVLNLNRSLRKDNSGYDLKHLFIGSEGTLGIITRATLRLAPQPREVQLLCLAVDSLEQLSTIFTLSQERGLVLSAFEFFSQLAYQKVRHCFPQVRQLTSEQTAYYGLMEIEGDHRSLSPQVEEFSQEVFDKGLAVDGIMAISSLERQELWFVRESITESLSVWGHVRKNDISLPLSAIAAFCHDLSAVKISADDNHEVVLFGHLGDGNIHLNYIAPRAADGKEFKQAAELFSQQVLRLIQAYRGSISAEHGIGLLKKADLSFTRSNEEIVIMKQIKSLFDERNILNPGKIF